MKNFLLFFGLFLFSIKIFAAEQASKQTATQASLLEIILNGGFVSILIWAMLAAVSFATIMLIAASIKKISSKNFVNITDADTFAKVLSSGNIKSAVAMSREKYGLFFKLALVGMINRTKGEDKCGEIISRELDFELSSTLRTISTLQMCGNIAPMLGLLGTVTGMVSAFLGLGAAAGPEKAATLAIAISQALYTTAAGLLIAVPALIAAHLAGCALESRAALTIKKLESTLSVLWTSATSSRNSAKLRKQNTDSVRAKPTACVRTATQNISDDDETKIIKTEAQ